MQITYISIEHIDYSNYLPPLLDYPVAQCAIEQSPLSELRTNLPEYVQFLDVLRPTKSTKIIHHQSMITSLQFGLLRYHFLPLLHPFHRIGHHLIDDLLGTLPLVDYSSSFTHQEWPCIIHCFVIDIIA